MAVEAPARWWHVQPLLRRYVADFVAQQLAVLRLGAPAFASAAWTEETDLRADLGIDSIELLALATSLTQALQLQRAGIEDYLLMRVTVGDWMRTAQAGLDAYADEMVFLTSGSTGAAKPCMHRLDALWQETGIL
ncbi:MAG TPA: hypothetical protein VIT92_04365, partial [Burkholderiaceae bacterium]